MNSRRTATTCQQPTSPISSGVTAIRTSRRRSAGADQLGWCCGGSGVPSRGDRSAPVRSPNEADGNTGEEARLARNWRPRHGQGRWDGGGMFSWSTSSHIQPVSCSAQMNHRLDSRARRRVPTLQFPVPTQRAQPKFPMSGIQPPLLGTANWQRGTTPARRAPRSSESSQNCCHGNWGLANGNSP